MRCPKGTRKNREGECIQNTQAIISTRCPKGTKKNREGECIKNNEINKSNKTNKTNKISDKKTNIVLSNLTESKLRKVLELCSNEKINYTFDKDYYSKKYYNIYNVMDDLILNNETIPIVYKKIVEGEYLSLIEDDESYQDRDTILDKIEHIAYV